MAFQQYNSAQAADIITDWHTDDDLSDEEQEDDEDFQPVLVAARPGNGRRTLGSCSDSSESSESSDSDSDPDSDTADTHTETTAGDSTLLGRDKTVWKSSATLVAGRTPAHNVFTGASGVPRQVSQSISTPYDSWKHFIPKSILCSIVKYTSEKAHRRGDTNFSLSLSDLEAFIALQYARRLYGKNHPVSFL